MDGLHLVLVIILGCILFHLGRHWKAIVIHHGIRDNGEITTQWGESNDTKFTIVGKVIEWNQSK